MTYGFAPVNRYTLQVERFSRYLQANRVPSWPIEDSLLTLRIIAVRIGGERAVARHSGVNR